MSTYHPRHLDGLLQRALRTAGAVHIQGPRGCGKTLTARQVCQSVIQLDVSSPATELAHMQPASGLAGATPRLLDEWQVLPAIWNAMRHEVDRRQQKGQFVLTGSAWPPDSGVRHSGAGRVRTLTMRTATWTERGLSTGAVSINNLFSPEGIPPAESTADLTEIAAWLCHGGLPAVWDDDVDVATDLAASYLDDIVQRDLASTIARGRDPIRFRRFLVAYAGLAAQPATMAAVGTRTGASSGETLNPETLTAYHDLAERMFLIEDQPAWSSALRSKGSLVKMPKRHLADSALVCALLGASPERLYAEPTFFGHLFESQIVHDLRCYTEMHRMRGVFHFRDTKGRHEIDVVIENSTGQWAGLDVKLGIGAVDEAAANLIQVASTVRTPPTMLVVVVPSGSVIRRDDGVWVIPATVLGP